MLLKNSYFRMFLKKILYLGCFWKIIIFRMLLKNSYFRMLLKKSYFWDAFEKFLILGCFWNKHLFLGYFWKILIFRMLSCDSTPTAMVWWAQRKEHPNQTICNCTQTKPVVIALDLFHGQIICYTCYIWPATRDLPHLTCYFWPVTFDLLYVACYIWPSTFDLLHVTRTWYSWSTPMVIWFMWLV